MTCDIAPNRIYSQYRSDVRPKLKKWYDITRTLGCELSSVAEEIRYSYDIDGATTFELDVLGRIVGVSRSFESNIELNPTAFGKNISQFGAASSQFGAASLDSSQELSNDIYKMLIKAKIAKNTSDATLDSIISALNYIIPSINTILIDNEDMSFSISFGNELTEVQRLVLNSFDIIPRPQGVEFLGYTEELTSIQFGGDFGWGVPRAQFNFTFGA